jgi:hypothetical protein
LINISGIEEPTAEIRNRADASINPFLRPYFLLIIPPDIPPIIQPIRALETTNPNRAFAAISPNPNGRTKKLSRELTVPDITAVSYPKSSPPNVATNVSFIRYLVFVEIPIVFYALMFGVNIYNLVKGHKNRRNKMESL